MSLIENIKKRGLKDIFSTRVFSYIEAQFQKIFGVWTKQEDQIAYSEQILYKGIVCSDCKKNGSCTHCGCSFPDLAVSKISVCSQGNWGKVMNNKDWENYKKTYLVGTEIGFVRKNLEKKDGGKS